MSVFTNQFVSAAVYEAWLRRVGERISVLSITNPTANSAVPLGSSGQQAGGPIIVKYQTSDRTLGPAMSKNAILVQVAIVAAIFFALFIYAILKL